jgi:hypothetical protein
MRLQHNKQTIAVVISMITITIITIFLFKNMVVSFAFLAAMTIAYFTEDSWKPAK